MRLASERAVSRTGPPTRFVYVRRIILRTGCLRAIDVDDILSHDLPCHVCAFLYATYERLIRQCKQSENISQFDNLYVI